MKIVQRVRGTDVALEFDRRVARCVLFLSVALLSFFTSVGTPVFAQSKNTKTVSVFKGRAVVTVPKTTKKAQKLFKNLYRAEPVDPAKKCVMFISRDPLGSDEVKMSNKALGTSIKTRLEGEGYTVLSMKTQGLSHTAQIEGYVEVPWQKVGTAPTRGVGKYTRTADKQLIGSVLLCDPATWAAADSKAYKTAVLKMKVSPR